MGKTKIDRSDIVLAKKTPVNIIQNFTSDQVVESVNENLLSKLIPHNDISNSTVLLNRKDSKNKLSVFLGNLEN